MEKTRKIGIYGGTFSPPHNGHVYVAKAFYDRLELDALYIIPSFIPPHKQVDSDDDPTLRLEMTKLAFSDHPDYGTKIFISDIELARGGKSYTADTLAYFKANVEGDLYFLCGTDMILTMDRWFNPPYIFENAKVVYARRESDRALDVQIAKKTAEYTEKYGADVISLDIKAYPLSSTEVRTRCRAEQDISGCVPDAVLQYIRKNALYRGK